MKITQMDPGLKDQGRVTMVEIDISARPDVATHYMVQSIPTVILFDQGREIKRLVGVQSRETLEKNLKDILLKRD